jgi:nicotinamidase-related amidase
MPLAEQAASFLTYLETWLAERPVVSMAEVVSEPEKTALVSVDVINGFLYTGPLSSPRVAAIDDPLTQLMQAAWDHGVREMVLVQEGHTEDSLEFEAYGAHAILGTPQAETIDKIKALPFYPQLEIVYKDSIHPAINTVFEDWINERPHLDTFIVVGDVTDLCVYHLATYLKFHANAYQKPRRVIVPANCVQTWDLSVEAAAGTPAMPHHGDLLHAIFLYHMALNAVEVVKAIEA